MMEASSSLPGWEGALLLIWQQTTAIQGGARLSQLEQDACVETVGESEPPESF